MNNKELEALFNKFDLNRDGFIDVNDLGNSLTLYYNMKLKDVTLELLFKKLDLYNSGHIRQIDFIKFLDTNYKSELIPEISK